MSLCQSCSTLESLLSVPFWFPSPVTLVWLLPLGYHLCHLHVVVIPSRWMSATEIADSVFSISESLWRKLDGLQNCLKQEEKTRDSSLLYLVVGRLGGGWCLITSTLAPSSGGSRASQPGGVTAHRPARKCSVGSHRMGPQPANINLVIFGAWFMALSISSWTRVPLCL